MAGVGVQGARLILEGPRVPWGDGEAPVLGLQAGRVPGPGLTAVVSRLPCPSRWPHRKFCPHCSEDEVHTRPAGTPLPGGPSRGTLWPSVQGPGGPGGWGSPKWTCLCPEREKAGARPDVRSPPWAPGSSLHGPRDPGRPPALCSEPWFPTPAPDSGLPGPSPPGVL